jgi:hypothetical protein
MSKLTELQKNTIEHVVQEADKIYADYLKRITNDSQFIALSSQARYEFYMKSNIDFARQNPIILRHIAGFGLHSAKAIRLYMKKCYNTAITSNESFAERQADFVKYLYMYNGKHMSQDKLHDIWAQTKSHILEELENNKKELDAVKEKREKNKETNLAERREIIKRALHSTPI